jgi:hypothetical protein
VPHRSRPNLSAAWQICGIFLLIDGGRVFLRIARRHTAVTKKHSLCRKENCAICFAFSLPQDSPAQLMFEMAGFGGAA